MIIHPFKCDAITYDEYKLVRAFPNGNDIFYIA